MLDGKFAVHVLMWNPAVFPGQPEQYSTGLGGLNIWYEIDMNAAGQKVNRFPFIVQGL